MIDGNALAGAFSALLGADVTSAIVRCSGCGAMRPVATAALAVTAMGAVARCDSCDAVLVTVVDDGERLWLGMPGVAALGVRRP